MYKGAITTCHMIPTGFIKVLIHNIQELEVLTMSNKTYSAEIAKNRKTLIERAAQLAFCITNLNARICAEENE